MKMILLMVVLGCLIGCSESFPERPKDPTEEIELITDFDFEISGDCHTPVLEVSFNNLSTQSGTYLWDFGDGTTSDLENPKKIYPKWSQYLVRLTITQDDKIESVEKWVFIMRNSDGTGPTGELLAHRIDSSLTKYNF